MRLALAGCAALLMAAAGVAQAQPASDEAVAAERRVAFSGSIGARQALLVIDGAPRAFALGERWLGVRLLSLDGDAALVEVDGQRRTLRLGAAAVHLGGAASPGSARVVTLAVDASGHFLASGEINGRGVRFLVDTGATLVSISRDEADRLGLDYKNAPRVGLSTANGTAIGHRIALNTVRLGDVDVHNVEAVVQPMPMPFVLLGNSFLTRFQMKRENDILTLERRF